MDGRSRYKKITQILKPIVGKELHMDKIRRRIMIDIGTSDNVVNETMRLMIDLGMIKEIKAFIFKVLRYDANI